MVAYTLVKLATVRGIPVSGSVYACASSCDEKNHHTKCLAGNMCIYALIDKSIESIGFELSLNTLLYVQPSLGKISKNQEHSWSIDNYHTNTIFTLTTVN